MLLIGQLTISIGMFNCYVTLPEGIFSESPKTLKSGRTNKHGIFLDWDALRKNLGTLDVFGKDPGRNRTEMVM